VSSDEEEEEEEEEVQPTKFLAVWKALYGVNMKEIVPGSSHAFQSSTGELLFVDIVDWKSDLLQKLGPKYKVVSLYTVASYQGSKVDEQLRSDLACLLDLLAMFSILTEWHARWPSKSLTLSVILQLQEEAIQAAAAVAPPAQTPQSTQSQRRSATATQEAALAFIYGTESATDDMGKTMNREWQCKSRDCRNMSKTCWRDKSKVVDHAHNHYPVKGETLRKWMAEINTGLSTVEQPSSSVVTEIVEQRARDKKRQPEVSSLAGVGVGGAAFAEIQAQTTTLLQSIALSQLRHQAPSSPSPFVGATTATTSLPAQSSAQVAPPSSPIQGAAESQEDELLGAFFAWCRALPKYSRKGMILRKAEEALVTGEWELSTLSYSAPAGKRLTDEDWKGMELPQGLLIALRSRLSEWKVYRKSMATTDDEFEDIA